jgi:hypothetical protein
MFRSSQIMYFLPINEPFDPAGGLYKCKTDGASKHKLGCLDQSNMVPIAFRFYCLFTSITT